MVAKPLVCAVITALTELSSSRLSSAPMPAIIKLEKLPLPGGWGRHLPLLIGLSKLGLEVVTR